MKARGSKEDGKLFGNWCESGECPVGYETVKRLMSVANELDGKKVPGTFFENTGFKVLAQVTQTREEDIRSALLEHAVGASLVNARLGVPRQIGLCQLVRN